MHGKQNNAGRNSTGPPRAAPWWVRLRRGVLQTTTDARRAKQCKWNKVLPFRDVTLLARHVLPPHELLHNTLNAQYIMNALSINMHLKAKC